MAGSLLPILTMFSFVARSSKPRQIHVRNATVNPCHTTPSFLTIVRTRPLSASRPSRYGLTDSCMLILPSDPILNSADTDHRHGRSLPFFSSPTLVASEMAMICAKGSQCSCASLGASGSMSSKFWRGNLRKGTIRADHSSQGGRFDSQTHWEAFPKSELPRGRRVRSGKQTYMKY
jgi:hypothetical protein